MKNSLLSRKIKAAIGAVAVLFVLAPCAQFVGQAPVHTTEKPLMNPKHRFWAAHAPKNFRVKIETTKGEFVIEAYRDWAPKGGDRFYNLVRARFFDNSRFFRVREGFIVQFGIPGDPAVGAVWRDQSMPDDPVRQTNIRGSIAFAMTGPGTRTTQLYINLDNNSRLDAQGFAPIGRVVKGMEIVDRLYAGYGEDAGGGMRGGKQDKLFEGGNQYLDREFPELDKLLQASVLPAALRRRPARLQ